MSNKTPGKPKISATKQVRTNRTKENRDKVLTMLSTAEAVTCSDAAKMAGMSIRSFYDWREADPEFDAEVRKAMQAGADPLKKVAYSHAKDGWDEPVYFMGKVVGTIRKFDHGLLTRVIEMREPKSKANLADELISLADELKAARERAEAKD